MIKAALGLAARSGPASPLSILIFHRVHARPDPLFPAEPDAVRFDRICGWLRGWFNILPLGEAVKRLRDGRLPSRAACITFDDGYADNLHVALPILQRHGLTATFFIATGYLDGGRMFNDTVIETVRRAVDNSLDTAGISTRLPDRLPLSSNADRTRAAVALIGELKYLDAAARQAWAVELGRRAGCAQLPEDLMLTSPQVRSLHQAGMEIGGHTVNHPILAKLGDDEARREIAEGRLRLEEITGGPVTLFAYPNGRPGDDYSARTVELVKEQGFAAAVSTAWGVSRTGTDRFQLPRFTPWDQGRLRFGLRLLTNLNRRATVLPLSAA